MKSVDLIAAALADGVTVRLDGGKLKVIGDAAAVNRWLPMIRKHKPEMIDLLEVGADSTVEPFDREAFEERAAICEFDGGLSRTDAEAIAWQEDDRRRCTQCLNRRPHDGVCKVAEPKVDAVVVANRSYAPDPILPRRCEGYAPKVSDPDQRPGAERWPGLRETLK